MGGIIDKAASILERRFLKNAFLPVLLFFPALAAPVLLQDGRLRATTDLWDGQSATIKVIEIVGYLAVVWFVSAVVASQWRNIIRLFEGYPLQTFAPRLAYRSELWHRGRSRHLADTSSWRQYYSYPAESAEILPTRLGNILRAAERYPYDRYGADTIILWPRLYHIMPRDFVDDVEEARATLEFLLVIALWCSAFGCLGAVTLFAFGSPPALTAAAFVAGMFGAYAAYKSALHAATEYGEQLRAAVELHRLELLQRLKLRAPRNLGEERALWSRVSSLLVRRIDGAAWRYREPPPPEVAITLDSTPPASS